MTGELFINGKDAYQEWGITLASDAVTALLTPPGMKDYVTNASRLEDGTRYMASPLKRAERAVDLTINLTAPTAELFISRYKSFCEELAGGTLELRTALLPGMAFRFLYKQCSQFSQLVRGIAKFSLSLVEPDPTDRLPPD